MAVFLCPTSTAAPSQDVNFKQIVERYFVVNLIKFQYVNKYESFCIVCTKIRKLLLYVVQLVPNLDGPFPVRMDIEWECF